MAVHHTDDGDNESVHGLCLAVSYLVHATVAPTWGDDGFASANSRADATFLWNQHSATVRQASLDGSDKSCQLLSTSVSRLTRGLSILLSGASHSDNNNNHDEDGWQDVVDASENADQAWHAVHTAEQKLTCLTVLTACFLALRPMTTAVTSIVTQTQLLLEQEEPMRSALKDWKSAMMGPNHYKFLWREDKALMDLFVSRSLAAVAVVPVNYHKSFLDLWLPYLPDNLDDYNVWQRLRVYKMARHQTYAVAALPAAALIVADPLLAVVAAFWSVPLTTTRVVTSWCTKPLHEFDAGNDQRRNFYHWRGVWQRLVAGATTST